jgi:hypothetical protein
VNTDTIRSEYVDDMLDRDHVAGIPFVLDRFDQWEDRTDAVAYRCFTFCAAAVAA